MPYIDLNQEKEEEDVIIQLTKPDEFLPDCEEENEVVEISDDKVEIVSSSFDKDDDFPFEI